MAKPNDNVFEPDDVFEADRVHDAKDVFESDMGPAYELGDDDIVHSTRPSRLFRVILMCLIVPIPVVLFCVIGYIAINSDASNRGGSRSQIGQSLPGQDEFERANNSIDVNRGEIGYGNNAAAADLARKFSAEVGVLRENLFTKRRKPAKFSLSKGQFLVFCQLEGDRCVFLVHVPDLRKYDREAKEFWSDVAWATARSVLQNADLPAKPTQIAVGLRGIFLYDRVVIGGYDAQTGQVFENFDREFEGPDSKERLYSFFEPVAAATAVGNDEGFSEPSNTESIPKPEPAGDPLNPQDSVGNEKPSQSSDSESAK